MRRVVLILLIPLALSAQPATAGRGGAVQAGRGGATAAPPPPPTPTADLATLDPEARRWCSAGRAQ